MSNESHLRYWLELGGASYPVREVRGEEALSELFRLEARVAVEGAGPNPLALVDADASLHLERAGQRVRSVVGIATSVRLVAAPAGAPELRVLVEPRLARARYRRDVRIYRDRTVPEVVVEALSRSGVSPELRLRGSYASRPYCVQYRETDLDFARRLLEDEGIFFFFIEERLVLGDSPAAYEPISGAVEVPFRDGSGLDHDQDAVFEIGEVSELGPGSFTLRDFCTDHPSLGMDVSAPGPVAGGPEWYDYPGEFADPGDGARKAQLHAEAAACQADALAGKSLCPRLAPGHTLQVTDAPPGAPEGELVVTRLRHDFLLEGRGYDNAFDALPAAVTFRPPRVTPVPVVTSPQTGIVTGPPGEDIHTDAFGRVKVHMHWDRQQPLDDGCSDWVPVLQENTGSSCAIPRIGWEVLVHFLEGDPDRPVVLGRLWNGEDELPYPLPTDKARSELRSFSSPGPHRIGDNGFNAIQMRDDAGAEQLVFTSERDQHVVVVHDKTEKVGSGETVAVDRDETLAVGNDQRVTAGKDVLEEIGGNQTVTVGGDRRATAGLEVNAGVDGDRSLSIAGQHSRRVGDADAAGGMQLVERVGGVILEASVGANSSEGAKVHAVTVGGVLVEVAGGGRTMMSSRGRVETVGGVVLTKAGGSIQVSAGKTRQTTVGGLLQVTATEEVQLAASEEVQIGAPLASLEGAEEISLKVGETEILFKDGIVRMKTKTDITITVTGQSTLGSGDSVQISS